jgi:ATP-dependent RNA helicase RhlE
MQAPADHCRVASILTTVVQPALSRLIIISRLLDPVTFWYYGQAGQGIIGFMQFADLGLLPELTRALADRNYAQPTPIQYKVIPEILAGRDILAGAQTGTGKTAGFTLPLLQRLHTAGRSSNSPRALVLVPTRELATQVADSIKSYGRYLRLRTLVVFGGVSINPQIEAFRRGSDILVATPGRLLDHAQQRTVDLSCVEMLVLDEADRMLDMGFIADIRRVLRLLPPRRQNLMFSATYTDEIRRLAQSFLHAPAEVAVARRNAVVDSVEQQLYAVAKEHKRALLSHLIRSLDWPQVLVFTRTKHGANRLTEQLLRDGIAAAAIHGNKSQSARTQALSDFKSGRVRALVATEVASRGLDIKELPCVVNFELPNVPEDYVHRIGRTGRAGSTGIAVSLVAPDEGGQLGAIEKVLGRRLQARELPVFDRTVSAEPQRPRTTDPRSRREPESRHQRGGTTRSVPRAGQRMGKPGRTPRAATAGPAHRNARNVGGRPVARDDRQRRH